MRNYKNIRLVCFRRKIPINTQLQELIINHTNIRKGFLLNNASHNVFLYLVHYVKTICENHFGYKADNIHILDWGCGHGHITYLLNQQGMKVTSCDVDEERGDSSFGQDAPIIEHSGIKVNSLKHSYKLPYDSCRFDAAVSFGVLEHVSNDYESLMEINRILITDGLFFCFFLPYKFSWTQLISRLRGNRYHDRLYTLRQTQNLLKQTGFRIIDIWHRGFFPKNTVSYHNYRFFERLDQLLTEKTWFKYFATNIEFVALKYSSKNLEA